MAAEYATLCTTANQPDRLLSGALAGTRPLHDASEVALPSITLYALFLSVLPCLGVAWYARHLVGGHWELLRAIVRMVLQLLAIGYALVFIFNSGNALVGSAVVLVMMLISALIGVRLIKVDRVRAFRDAVVALGIAGLAVLAWTMLVVLELHDPLYQPRLIVPIAGMIFSNAMTGITLAAERLQSELSRGADFKTARSAAWTAALIPQINALLAVGLVSLPGMMTGQILSGVDPLIAVRYQIVIMAMLLQACGFSVAIYLALAGRRLDPERQ